VSEHMPPQETTVGDILRGVAETGEYWIFVWEGMEWRYLLNTIAEDFIYNEKRVWKKGEPKADGALPMGEEMGARYFLRSLVPEEVLVARLGVKVDDLRKHKVLRLLCLDDGQVKPTVVGYGRA
jgi:hypothetical protein